MFSIGSEHWNVAATNFRLLPMKRRKISFSVDCENINEEGIRAHGKINSKRNENL